MHTVIDFRPAAPADVDVAVPLIVSSGPQAVEYGFALGGRAASGFLSAAYLEGRGLFGWAHHTVAVVEGEVAAIAATYGCAAHLRMSLEHAQQVWRHYRWPAFAVVMRRGLHLRSLMPAPPASAHYLAHFGVQPARRGQGIGLAMLEHQRERARQLGRRTLVLDVSVENTRAAALYRRFGLQDGVLNRFTGPADAVPDTRRMQMRVL